jgi:hypothetical protein
MLYLGLAITSITFIFNFFLKSIHLDRSNKDVKMLMDEKKSTNNNKIKVELLKNLTQIRRGLLFSYFSILHTNVENDTQNKHSQGY